MNEDVAARTLAEDDDEPAREAEQRAMMEAAYRELRKVKKNKDGNPAWIDGLLKGWSAAKKVPSKGLVAFDVALYVASALYAVVHDMDIAGVHPTCAGIEPWIAYSQVFRLVAMGDVLQSELEMTRDGCLPDGDADVFVGRVE